MELTVNPAGTAAPRIPIPEAEPRITTTELCGIAKLSRITIQRRINAGIFPAPIDRGREFIFDRGTVYRALGIATETKHEPKENPWERGARALAKRQVTNVCRRKAAG